jgi:hypothetical protein
MKSPNFFMVKEEFKSTGESFQLAPTGVFQDRRLPISSVCLILSSCNGLKHVNNVRTCVGHDNHLLLVRG